MRENWAAWVYIAALCDVEFLSLSKQCAYMDSIGSVAYTVCQIAVQAQTSFFSG